MKLGVIVSSCLVCFVLCSACDRQDKREAQRTAEQAREKARELGKKAEDKARDLSRDIQTSVDSNVHTNNAQEAKAKVREGGRELERAGSSAARQLDRAALIAKVKARLASDAGLTAAANVDVEPDGQVITLNGSVDSEAQKRQAETTAAKVPGVSKVVNNLTVR
jgi:hyperosmotically inducible periplasmic protein